MSRFSRTSSSETPDSVSAPAANAPSPAASVLPPATGSAEVSDLTARYQELQERGKALEQRRGRYEYQLENVTRTDQRLTQQAAALGAKTPEDFLVLIEAQEKADREALDRYEEELNAQKALLDSIDRDLAEQDEAE